MKLYLDDVRKCPDGFFLCRTAEDAIQIIDYGEVVYISFDHDLGGDVTGYDVAKHIEEEVAAGNISCPDWDIHSSNPVGRKNIQAAMISAKRLGEERSL